MSKIEKYKKAWDLYLVKCKRYEIEKTISFSEFKNYLTTEQVEMMLKHSL